MLRQMCKSKIHRATVTDANLNYMGSITIDAELMKAADILPFEMVHINSLANATHWETYAIPGRPGEICLNGCPARLFQPGDQVIILSLGLFAPTEFGTFRYNTVVFVDEKNQITKVEDQRGDDL